MIEDIKDYCLFYFITISEKVVETQRIDVQFSSDSMLTDSVAKMDSFNLREQLIFNFLLDFSMLKSEKKFRSCKFSFDVFFLIYFSVNNQKTGRFKVYLNYIFCKRKKNIVCTELFVIFQKSLIFWVIKKYFKRSSLSSNKNWEK